MNESCSSQDLCLQLQLGLYTWSQVYLVTGVPGHRSISGLLLLNASERVLLGLSLQLLGKWYIIRWAGTIPFPREKLLEPLPPFSFVVNSVGKLEFQMRILKPSGCQLFKLPLSVARVPASFVGWWKHMIYIWLVTPRSYGIAYFGDRMNNRRVQMMMLFGRTLDEHPGALMIFEVFVEKKGLNKADLIHPPHLDACEPDAVA
ncbi:uncharacterized protein [Dipodomys merriami]|uniref:uncharacterized protein n=1 Tax=Dipodomys merriami TaxID=94247 RepID=UPI00384A7F8C